MSTVSTIQRTSAYHTPGPSVQYPHMPALSALIVLIVDILCLTFILWLFLGATTMGRHVVPGGWLPLWSIAPFFVALYAFVGLYPGVSMNPIDEIRGTLLANGFGFFLIAVLLALHRPSIIPLLTCLSTCIGASFLVLVMRTLVRRIGSQFQWWGHPVVLFGSGPAARLILNKLRSRPCLGLRVVAIVADHFSGRELDGIPVYRSEYLRRIASCGVKHVVVAAPELSHAEFSDLVERGGDCFPSLILIPEMESIWKIGSYTSDLTGVLGLHVRNNLLDGGSRLAKRIIDLTFASSLLLFSFPLLALIALAVIVESGFPIFYLDNRLGHHGRPFYMWKFRTMMPNSALVLANCIAASPELRKEWEENQKLRNDPRITRIGKILRKTSLDEIPQLWNVVRGEMSLVGPRPIISAEVSKYRECYSLYSKAVPGLTGMWQVSGRNRTTYAERVSYDSYYIRNWSVWMDVYLLAKTVGAVITGDGAY